MVIRDWMRDHDLDKIFWRVVAVLVLMFAFNIKVVHLSSDQARKVLDYKREHYTTELNEYELNEFINLYPKFKQYAVLENKNINNIAEYPDKADWVTKRWFTYQAWDITRFFYVKKRVLEALEIIRSRKEAAGFIDQLSKRVQKNEEAKIAKNPKNIKTFKTEKVDDNDYDIAKQMLHINQQQAENTGDFSENELKMIEKKADDLKKLFN